MIEVREIAPTKKELRKYVEFPATLYKGNTCYVPPLAIDDINTLTPEKNPAFDFCEAQSFMAYRHGKPVGRITAIINSVENERMGNKAMRFGFVDFVDDAEVVDALFGAAEKWGRRRGCTSILGPMGFSDIDHEGMLTFGYDELGTMSTIYNHPYYVDHMKRMGYTKDAGWVEFLVDVPKEVPEKYMRVAQIAAKRNNLRVKKYTSRKKIKEEYGVELFELFNKAYDNLYGYCPMTRRQIDSYIEQYVSVLNLDLVTLVVDKDDRLVAVGIALQSFSRALQKSGGKMLPAGWWHLLQAWRAKGCDRVDLMMIGVLPEYQNKGVNAMIFADLIPHFNRYGFRWAETNIELEDNAKVQDQWQYFGHRLHRRRCTFRKEL